VACISCITISSNCLTKSFHNLLNIKHGNAMQGSSRKEDRFGKLGFGLDHYRRNSR
jgi:hypothetical protein